MLTHEELEAIAGRHCSFCRGGYPIVIENGIRLHVYKADVPTDSGRSSYDHTDRRNKPFPCHAGAMWELAEALAEREEVQAFKTAVDSKAADRLEEEAGKLINRLEEIAHDLWAPRTDHGPLDVQK